MENRAAISFLSSECQFLFRWVSGALRFLVDCMDPPVKKAEHIPVVSLRQVSSLQPMVMSASGNFALAGIPLNAFLLFICKMCIWHLRITTSNSDLLH